jgi:hypothetical protein
MAAKYRILVPRFWVDPLTQDLNDRQCRVFSYCVQGPQAAVDQNCTGIYELYRGTFQNSPFRYELSEIDEVFDFFNKRKPRLLQYDSENHVVFIPSMFKHNGSYKKRLGMVMHSFAETFHKAPQFWIQFADKYYLQLFNEAFASWEGQKADGKCEEEMKFLERLKNIREEVEKISHAPGDSKAVSAIALVSQKKHQL